LIIQIIENQKEIKIPSLISNSTKPECCSQGTETHTAVDIVDTRALNPKNRISLKYRSDV
jgi:hypothetical protein